MSGDGHPTRADTISPPPEDNGPAAVPTGEPAPAFFRIDYDRERLLLRWALTGIWSEHVVRTFAAALARYVVDAEREHADFVSLGNSTDFPRQATEVTRALQSLAHLAIGRAGRKVAIVTGRPLTERQAERAAKAPSVRFFPREDQALSWLGVD